MRVRPLLELIPRWETFVGEVDTPDIGDRLHPHASTWRLLGPDAFVEDLERRLRRPLWRQKPGPKPQKRDASSLLYPELQKLSPELTHRNSRNRTE